MLIEGLLKKSFGISIIEQCKFIGDNVPRITNIDVNRFGNVPYGSLYLFSRQIADGDSTEVEVGIIRYGYSGDHATKIRLGGTVDSLIVGVSNHKLTVSVSGGGNANVFLIG